ncbi:outer membrane protein transport protein [Maribacter sp. TH_r10]|uniref:Aromatic hydrocarbon degradation protein n=1 Tax=Maribacter luteus TaxID=2594478 RepID=A0A6I2MQB6_9FLAO|nr:MULTISPECIES: outer membrane protein transport protein [Maribacter]MDV7140828.1 outer membrane protein transport protein [Maribacter sp. TH_r10]MRX65032.1 aromatic hydrocarbon degradation protein [Maribacter luteus]
MKRYLTFIVLLACTVASAQNLNDVLRYSQENLQGTARFQGMGGAFGALGGDLSALNINPAGSAVFNNSQFTVSGSNYHTDNTATYFGTGRSANENNFNLNQVGGVFVFKSRNDSDWKKMALAINYDMVQSFDDEYRISGTSDQGIDNYFLNYADGVVPFNSILIQDGEYIENAYLDIGAYQGFTDQQAFLGYYGGIIDPVGEDDTTTDYIRNASYSNVNQDYARYTSGYNSKFNLNFATQYQNNLYLGASLNFHTVFYDQFDEIRETGYDSGSAIQRTDFSNFLHTEGSGFSFNLGAIAKVNQNIRVGGSYQSPTWYRLTDDLSQRINSDLADSEINFINHDIINLFEEYTIKTPAKLTGSVALIFGRDGLLSFDYDYQDMSQAELRPTSDSSFSTVNSEIANNLDGVSSFRLGGEYRIERVSLRAGYRFEQSPYADGNNIGDLNAYSGGIGYNFGGSRLDLAYNRTERDYNLQLFDTGLPTPALINKQNTNITLSYTLNF